MATVTRRSQKLRNDEGSKDLDEEEEKEGCIHNTAKDRNEGYYTGAIGASKLNNLLSSHHRANGKGVHMPVGDNS